MSFVGRLAEVAILGWVVLVEYCVDEPDEGDKASAVMECLSDIALVLVKGPAITCVVCLRARATLRMDPSSSQSLDYTVPLRGCFICHESAGYLGSIVCFGLVKGLGS